MIGSTSPLHRRPGLLAILCALLTVLLPTSPTAHAAPPSESPLEQAIGRSEVRLFSAPFPLEAEATVWDYALADRLQQLGYRRVRQQPQQVGEFFWGNEVFWIYRRPFQHAGDSVAAQLLRLELEADSGRILGASNTTGTVPRGLEASLEPMLLAESLEGARARRLPCDLDDLPEHVWRPVLAAEDARFFSHMGLDARSLARALLANAKAGKVTQGGSTITQQLIKNRDLTPRRSLGRKASEALRSLALEADYDKKEILQAYLNQVYLGHVDGLAVHGFGAGAKAYFDKRPQDLTLPEAALLAAIIQGPNRLSPQRHPEAARQRRDWVLQRMAELEWAEPAAVERARVADLGLKPGGLEAPLASHFRSWIKAWSADEVPRRIAKGRGLRIETSLDPWAQAQAEATVRRHLDTLRRRGGDDLSMALVALDADSGDVVAYVGGHPGERSGGFDRARSARRQPGSTIKPLLLLQAFDSCGRRQSLYPAARVADEPLRVDLPSGPWEPRNSDERFRGTVTLRRALLESLNVPFVRLTRWCGVGNMAQHLRQAGLDLPKPPPLALALGAVETSPLQLAAAYTAVAAAGQRYRPRPVLRIETPGGRSLKRVRIKQRRLVDSTSAYLVHDLMRSVVDEGGTARAVAIDGWQVAAKTGTTSERRDAWLAGYGNGLVTVVWVGRDDGKPLGMTGSSAAAPPWRDFMVKTMGRQPRQLVRRPAGVVELHVDRRTGLLVRPSNPHAELELFRQDTIPRRDRFWRRDEAVPIIE